MMNLRWVLKGALSVRASSALVLLGLFLFAPAAAQAQQDQGRYVTETAERLRREIAQGNRDGYVLYNNYFSAGGGWLLQGQNNWVNLFTIELEAGRSYRLIAAGDGDAQDVDLEVRDLDGRRYAIDDSTDPDAVINFTPETTRRYQIRVRLYSSRQNLPCFCMAIVMVRR